MRAAAASHSERAGALACSRMMSSVLRADAARRQVHDALERRVVGAARDQPQVGERVLDFRALEEPQAAVHAIRNARRDERFFEHARLRVRAVQDRDVAPRAALRSIQSRMRLMTNSASSRSLNAAYSLIGSPCCAGGPEVLAEPAGVVGDQRVRRIEDVAGGAIVLLEAEQLRVRKVAAELRAGSRRARRASGRSTDRRRRRRTARPRARRAASASAYWMAFVSWNSSTSTWRKRVR